MMDDINESDCCGNGCANCVLNCKSSKFLKANKAGKQNLLFKYTKFYLINKTLHQPKVPNVWELHFKSKYWYETDFILNINAGYHLMMRKTLTDKDVLANKESSGELQKKYLLRPYSPYWWSDMEMEFKILVQLIPKGPMSEYINKLEINDEVEFRGPIGIFDHQIDTKGDKCLIIISQGVAVAPVIAIIQEILNDEDDMTKIIHIACFQDLEHLYFRDKLYNFTSYWNYKIYTYLSREVCNNTECLKNTQCLGLCTNFKSKLKYKENIRSLRLTAEELLNIVSQLKYKKENIYVTIAGSGKFQNNFKNLLQTKNYGILGNNIYLL